jgi:cell division septation protein DedD
MEDLQGKAGSAETITVDSTQKAPAPKSSPALPGGASGGLVGRDLSDAPASPKTAPGASSQPRPAPAPAPTLAARTPADTMAQPTVQPPRPAEPAPAPPPKTEAKSSGAGFEATYQVASFFKKDQADAMVKKLAKQGFRAEIRQARIQDKDVFRIAVTLRGTEQEIKAGLEKTGEKGPILLGKKPL